MSRRAAAGIALGLALGLLGPTTRADRIRLRSGGEIRGHVLDDPTQPGKVLVQTEGLEKPLVLERDRVLQIIPEDDIFDLYHARRSTIPATAQAEYDFGLWCERNRLTALANTHYRRAIELDKDFEPARKKLGHVRFQGVWMTYAEQRQAQGLMLYKGKWVSHEERERLAERADQAAAETAWARQVQILKQNLASPSPVQVQEAERHLRDITDPAAVPALAKSLGEGPGPHRRLFAEIVGRIAGPEARSALIHGLLREDDATVRSAFLAELTRRAEPEAVAQLLRALRARDAAYVGQAARALADLNARTAVPQLVNELVRTETRSIVMPNAASATAAFGAPAAFAAAGNVSIPVLTGPVVGPGVAAFGATSVPFGSGVALGMGTGPQYNMPTVRLVRLVQNNPAVLAALETLTGQNFGYDQIAWRQWIRTSFRAEPEPARRVPQP